jgi:hypothetical protein
MDQVKGMPRQRRSLPKDGELSEVTDLISKHRPLLEAMMGRLRAKHENAAADGTLLQTPWQVVEWIPWGELGAAMADMPQAQRYMAADDGAVIYEQAEAGDRVRFAAPQHAILLRERLKATGPQWPEWFDARERAAVRFPASILGSEAEDILRRCMMEAGWQPSGAAAAAGTGAGAGAAVASAVTVALPAAGATAAGPAAAAGDSSTAADLINAKLIVERRKTA